MYYISSLVFLIVSFAFSVQPFNSAFVPEEVFYNYSVHSSSTLQVEVARDICLARWEWVTDANNFSSWKIPFAVDSMGSLDLRSLPQMSSSGPPPEGYGLFTYNKDMGSSGMYCLGGNLDSEITTAQANTIALSLGKRTGDLEARSIRALIKELLLTEADPTGQTFWKPLGVSPTKGYVINLEGFGSIVEEPFSLTHPAFANTLAVRLDDYDRNVRIGVPLDALERWTGYDMLKYHGRRGDDLLSLYIPQVYLDAGHRQRAPKTIITDDFNRADGELGANWTDDNGDADILSNMWDVTTSEAVSRNINGLSSDDHYVKAAIINTPSEYTGPMARKSGDALLTYYAALKQSGAGGPVQIFKRVSGTYTQLGANIPDSFISGDIYEVRVDGSSIEFWKNGSQVEVRTDTTLTGSLQTGLVSNDTGMAMDDFEAADLVMVSRVIIID